MRPAHLRTTNHWIGEEVDELAQAIGLRNKVGVEDREQLTLGKLVAVLQRSGFESGAIGAVNVVDIKTLRRILRHDCFCDLDCLIGRIVENLDLQLVMRIVDCGHGFEQTIYHVELIKEWKLDRNSRQLRLGKSSAGMRDELAITPEVDDLLDAIRAIDGERAKDREVDDQDDPIEGVEFVEWADISPGFVYEVVKVALEQGLRRRPPRAWPWRWCWGLKHHAA